MAPSAPPQPSKASLSKLPHELLSQISNYLDSKRDISYLARSSRTLYEVAQPHLFRDIELTFSAWMEEIDLLRHLQIILNVLIRRPDLAQAVRQLRIVSEDPAEEERDRELGPWLPDVLTAVRGMGFEVESRDYGDERPLWPMRDVPSVAEQRNAQGAVGEALSTGHPEGQFLGVRHLMEQPDTVALADVDLDTLSEDGDAEGNDDAMEFDDNGIVDDVDWATTDDDADWSDDEELPYSREPIMIALLIGCLTRIKTLDLEIVDLKHLRTLHSLISNPRAKAVLPNLKSVCFGSPRADLRTHLWLDLFNLPSVTHIYLHHVVTSFPSDIEKTIQFNTPPQALKPRSRPITHLEIRGSRIAPAHLDAILRVPQALKCFIYEIGERINGLEPAVNGLSYKSVADALRHQKDSLEDIWIDYPHDYEFDEWGAGMNTRPMGSFKTFTSLKRFRIASTYLFGFVEDTDPDRLRDSLPEQLEFLHLTHADEDEELTKGLRVLLDTIATQGRFPALKHLHVDVCVQWMIRRGRPPHGDTGKFNKDAMHELIELAKTQRIEMRLWDNHSHSRVRNWPSRISQLSRSRKGPKRREEGWGFEGEVREWKARQNGCRLRPEYEELGVDGEGNLVQIRDRGVTRLPSTLMPM